jgi:hypothetical protein
MRSECRASGLVGIAAHPMTPSHELSAAGIQLRQGFRRRRWAMADKSMDKKALWRTGLRIEGE